MPNIDNLLKWVHDLETTDAYQTENTLFDGTGYCCLGRLCKVAGLEFHHDPFNGEWYVNDGANKAAAYAPDSVITEFLGFDDVYFDQTRYSNMNDSGQFTFPEIAANIRSDFSLGDKTDA